MKTIHLLNPIGIDGQQVAEIKLDLDQVDGAAILEGERKCRLLGDNTPDVQFSKTFAALMAAKASGIKYDDIQRLRGPDFMHVTNVVSNFLFGGIFPVEGISANSGK